MIYITRQSAKHRIERLPAPDAFKQYHLDRIERIQMAISNSLNVILPEGTKIPKIEDTTIWLGEFADSEPVSGPPKCECGSVAVGVDKHSSWCALSKKEEKE